MNDQLDNEKINELSRKLDEFEKRLNTALDKVHAQQVKSPPNPVPSTPVTPNWPISKVIRNQWDLFYNGLNVNDRDAVVGSMNSVWTAWQSARNNFAVLTYAVYPNFQVALTVNEIRELYDLTDCIRTFMPIDVAKDEVRELVILYKS